MGAEGAGAGGGDAGAGARTLADEILFDPDIAGAFERREMAAEIAVGGADQGLQPAEFERLGCGRMERGHDPQAQRLVDDLVGLGHAQTLRIQRPPSTSPPPPAAAIQKGRNGLAKTKPDIVTRNMIAPIAT